MSERRLNTIVFICTIAAIPLVLWGVASLTVQASVAAFEPSFICTPKEGGPRKGADGRVRAREPHPCNNATYGDERFGID